MQQMASLESASIPSTPETPAHQHLVPCLIAGTQHLLCSASHRSLAWLALGIDSAGGGYKFGMHAVCGVRQTLFDERLPEEAGVTNVSFIWALLLARYLLPLL